jgi:hypothetical protein
MWWGELMRGRRIVTVLAGAAALLCAAPLAVSAAPGAPAAAGAVAWGKAIEVPGMAALNTGGNAQVTSVSCATSGNCSAGGIYADSSGHRQAFVVGETDGTWGTAIEVPGTAALNLGGTAEVRSVSCASAGNCSAGGGYRTSGGGYEAFVVSENNGTWGTAIEAPGSGILNTGGDAVVSSVSCGAAGNCAAGGFYYTKITPDLSQAFVISQKNGTWGKAIEVPGTATLNTGGDAVLRSVSCASAGNCSAGGSYAVTPGHSRAFVARETDGTWASAFEVPGTAALNTGANASLSSVSCARAGTCAGGGFYTAGHGATQGFVVSQS